MFDVGFAELFLLALIGLLVLGPERLPRVANNLGRLLRKARTSWFALRRSIEAELAAADVSEPVKSAGRELEKAARDFNEFASNPVGEEADRETDATPAEPDDG